jgi:hypothetical protein
MRSEPLSREETMQEDDVGINVAGSRVALLQSERRILRISIAQTPNPDPTSPVIAPVAEPMNSAFAQSGQTSRPVIVSSNGS